MPTTDGAIDWNQLEELFHAALALKPADRAYFLDRNCSSDAALRQEIESLIALSSGTVGSLKRPVETLAQTLAWAESGKSIGPFRSDGRGEASGFGIAKLMDADAGEALTRGTERIMTPEYASPEQVRGEQVTTATDVYSLGVLLYELLAGTRPFRLDNKSPLEVIRVIGEEQPPAPSSLRSTAVPGEPRAPVRMNRDLDNIVLMAMRKEPSRRYPGIPALASDIRAYLSGYPVQARTDPKSSSAVTRRA